MTAETTLGFRPCLDGYYDAAINLQMQVYRRSEEEFDRWERHKDSLATPADLARWQAHIREAALAAIGGLPAGGTPLEPETVGALAGDGYDVEKLIYQSLPGVFVTASLYLPRGLTGRTGAVVFACGHAEEAKGYPHYQAVCQRLARNGLVVLAVDPVGQGERKSYLDERGAELVRWGVTEHTYAGHQCWWTGQSIARYFVHDLRRAIDYLETRPEVDPARIGITGNSGGGTQSTWMMLLEPRLAAAAPATFVMRRREYMWAGQAQDAEQVIVGGTAAGLDHEDFILAMAPRPVRVLAVEYDFFPLESTVATVERARRIYRLLGHEDRLSLVHTASTHEYHPALARAATEFFVQHLRGGDPREVDHAEPRPVEARDLWCTRSGQVLLDRPAARRVFDLNLAEHRARPAPPADPATRASAAAEWLEARVRHDRRPGQLYPRWLTAPAAGGTAALHGFWWAERGALGAGALARPAGREYDRLTIALFDQGTAELDERRAWLGTRLTAGEAVLALDVRGMGALAPHQLNPAGPEGDFGALYKLNCDLMCLGDSLAAARVYDVLRAVDLATTDREVGLAGRPVHLYAAGLGVLYAYLAAALDRRIARLELADPLPDLSALLATRLYSPGRAWQWIIPGLASRFDLADLHPLFAGRALAAP